MSTNNATTTTTTTTTPATPVTPVEAAAAIAAMLAEYDTAIAAKKAAEQNLDQAGLEAAEADLAQIRGRVRSMMACITTEKIGDGRCRALILAASRGATPQDLRAIAEAVRVSTGDGVTVPMHHYETLSRGRGWARLGRGEKAVWGERTEGGYRLRQEGRWVVGGHDGFSRRGETIWDVRRVVDIWIAN
jgi:hypothetical protein